MINRTEGKAMVPQRTEGMPNATQVSTNGGRKVSTDHKGSFIHKLALKVLTALSTFSTPSEVSKLSLNNLKARFALFILPYSLSDKRIKAMSPTEKGQLLNTVRLARKGLSVYGGPSKQKLCDALDALAQNLLPPPTKEDEKAPPTPDEVPFTQEQIPMTLANLFSKIATAGKTPERKEAFELLKNDLTGVNDNHHIEIRALNTIEQLAKTAVTAEDVIALKEALETCKKLASLSTPADKQMQARLNDGYKAAQEAVDAASGRVVASLLGKVAEPKQ